jgi:DNA-binding winged helix-turn-helix (wHTH) protein
MAGSPLSQMHDFTLGAVHVRPAARAIESSKGCFVTEPLVMQLLVELSRNAGRVVSRRDIFESCWGSAPVGDDSLNRIVAALRKTLSMADGGTVLIETIPGAGYTLRLRADAVRLNGASQGDVEQAIQEGLDSVRAGLPQPDNLRLEMLRRAVLLDPQSSAAWGMRALLCRYAAEYAEASEVAEFVAECQSSARRALQIEGEQPDARVALATVAPIFGRWLEARTALMRIVGKSPNAFVANHELVICDMATGRVRAAVSRTDDLIAAVPLAACLIYKGIYQHWSIGDLLGMDQLGERGMHLWPTHPAIWTARLWTLAFTGRIEASLDMLQDEDGGPDIPQPMLQLLKTVISAASTGTAGEIERAAAAARQAAASGPARAIAALFALGLLHRVDDAFAVAEAYYLREGTGPVPLRPTDGEPAINDLHRRVTQILFTPACAEMRDDRRFLRLCERAGLAGYWEQTGLRPDFLA